MEIKIYNVLLKFQQIRFNFSQQKLLITEKSKVKWHLSKLNITTSQLTSLIRLTIWSVILRTITPRMELSA